MPSITVQLMGRFGNQCMQWLFAKAMAEKTGTILRTTPWIGEKVFDIECLRPTGVSQETVNENGLIQWSLLPREHQSDVTVVGYAQMQQCMIYTKREAQQWLRIRDELRPYLDGCTKQRGVYAHRRVGDYPALGYPVVSEFSYQHACWWYGLQALEFVTEEAPIVHPALSQELAFLPDFYQLMRAPTLLRGNSSFSWMAALLGDGLVLSPVITDDHKNDVACKFLPGNWPRFCHLDFVTDLHLRET